VAIHGVTISAKLLAELINKLAEGEMDHLSDAEAAVALSAKTVPEVYSRRIDERTILQECFSTFGEADAFLRKLETLSETDTEVARILKWLAVPEEQGGGLDLGDERLRGVFGRLVGAKAIGKADSDAVLPLAERKTSWAAQHGESRIRPGWVAEARRRLKDGQ